jgi:radical SAM superfamily enzyme YgiQ (UPF0313 family)
LEGNYLSLNTDKNLDDFKVLIISANREKLPDPVYPLGASYIASACSNKGISTSTVDLCFEDDPLDTLEKALLKTKPDVIGLSVRNIDDVAYPNPSYFYDDYKAVVSICRAKTGALIIIGGSAFSVMPESFMENLDVDYGILGEGEDTFPAAVECIKKGESIKKLPGITYNENGAVIKNSKSNNQTGEWLIPQRNFFDLQKYYTKGGCVNVQTKRGCVYNCIYCTYPLIEGNKIKSRSAEDIINEIKYLQDEFNTSYIFFVDSVFNYPTDSAIGICNEIIKNKLDIKWTAYMTPAGVTNELVCAVKESGCTGIEFGVESCSDTVLKCLQKGFCVDDVKRTRGLFKKYEMKCAFSIMFGSPGETISTLKESTENLDLIAPDAIIAMIGIRIYPGTKLAKLAVEEGMIKSEAELGLKPSFYISKDVAEVLTEYVRENASKRRNWIVPGLNIKMNEAFFERIRNKGFKGPIWEKI